MPELILASTSIYRQQLLAQLCIPFQAQAPSCDETPLPGESAQQLVLRLAKAKAQSLQAQHPQATLIGSDQVASFNGSDIIGKPGNHEQAVQQLQAASGQRLTFYTGVHLAHPSEPTSWVSEFHVQFRPLQPEQIERYLRIEKPYDCAGSFKSEGLGVMLFAKLEGDDPSSLIGLPLIRLYQELELRGFHAQPSKS